MTFIHATFCSWSEYTAVLWYAFASWIETSATAITTSSAVSIFEFGTLNSPRMQLLARWDARILSWRHALWVVAYAVKRLSAQITVPVPCRPGEVVRSDMLASHCELNSAGIFQRDAVNGRKVLFKVVRDSSYNLHRLHAHKQYSSIRPHAFPQF